MYSPSRVEGLTLSVNYSEIEYRNRIDGVTGTLRAIVYNSIADEHYPSLYLRNAENKIDTVDTRAVNIEAQWSGGYDATVDYELETGIGDFSLTARLTVNDHFEQVYSGVLSDRLGVEVPKHRYDLRFAYQRDGLRAVVGANGQDDLVYRTAGISLPVTIVTTKSPFAVNASLSYSFEAGLFGALDNLRLEFGVNNLGDKFVKRENTNEDGSPSNQSPFSGVPDQTTRTGGRAYYLELRKEF